MVGNPTMPKVANKPGDTPQPLAQLPETENEVKAISPLFQTQPLIGKDATKLAILPILPKARIGSETHRVIATAIQEAIAQLR